MNYDLTESQKELYKSILKFFRTQINNELNHEFSRDAWRKCADFGLLALPVPEKYGGLGESYLSSAIATMALGHACDDSGFVFAINNHLWACQTAICICGNDMQKEKYLPSMVNGNMIGAFACTEPDAGSDPINMKTYAEHVGNGYRLNGRKCFISNAPIANVILVIARTSKTNTLAGLTAFLVETNNTGVIIEKETQKMGLQSCPMSDVVFDNCIIDENMIVGKMGSGINVLNTALEWERCFEFASHIGAMKRIMHLCLDYSKQRIQFQQTIGNYQAVAHKIADMKVRVELSELLLYKIVSKKDEMKHAYVETSIFKLFVSESYVTTCVDALQIFGAYGYASENKIENELRCALASTIYAGTSEIHRNTLYGILSATKESEI